jgi:hypothetical protein
MTNEDTFSGDFSGRRMTAVALHHHRHSHIRIAGRDVAA